MIYRWMMPVGLLAMSLSSCSSTPPEIGVGTVVPAFKLRAADADGKLVASESLKGRTTVLVFWSTTCSICLKELEDLRIVHDSGEAVVVAVALDEDNDRVRRFLKSKKDSHKPISFPVLLGNEEVFTRFEGYGIPYTLVLDRSLTIRHKANGRIALGNLVRIIDEIGGQQVRVIPREDDSRIARTNE